MQVQSNATIDTTRLKDLQTKYKSGEIDQMK